MVFILLFSKIEKLYTNHSIHGVWVSKTKSGSHKYVFNKDGTCMFTLKDNNRIFEGNFKIDFSKVPISLSIRNISDIDHPLHTIVEFIDQDSIRMAMMSSKWRLRPISFDSKTLINLKRINLVDY